MRGRLSSKAVTPLLEVVVILFFFAFMSTMVLRLFVMSYQRSILARDINMALWVAQDVAEGLRGGMTLEDMGMKPEEFPDNRSYQIHQGFYGAEWQPSSFEDARYVLMFGPHWNPENTNGGILYEGNISAYRIDGRTESGRLSAELVTLLTSFPFAHHIPIGGGG